MGPIWIICAEIFLPNSMPSRAIATDGPLLQGRFWRCVQSIVSVVLLLGLFSSVVRGQAQPASQLFTILEKDKLLDQTPAQSERLARLRKLATTKSVTVVKINPAALSSNQLGLLLPGVNSLHALRTGGDMRDSRDFTWTGTLEDGQRGGTTLVIRNSEVTGSISSPAGLYRISPLGGGVHALVEIDPTKFPKDEPESFRSKESQQVQFTSSPGTSGSRDRADSAPTQIDVLVAYTTAAKAGVNDIDATIALALAEANQSYIMSGIKINLNLVDSFQISYLEKGKSFETILSEFVGMKDVNKRRDQAGADLAVLIIDQADFCGLADAIMADASTAFAIVHYNCATGYYSFAHELGHLMGARHNEQEDPSASPFPYGHGYRHDSPPPAWRTIMSYDCPQHCNRLQYWSNPNLKFGGIPLGTSATNDNARVLNTTATTVAGFRTRPVH